MQQQCAVPVQTDGHTFHLRPVGEADQPAPGERVPLLPLLDESIEKRIALGTDALAIERREPLRITDHEGIRLGDKVDPHAHDRELACPLHEDPADLARRAVAMASSVALPGSLEPPSQSPAEGATTKPRPKREEMYRAANVVNGFARAIRGWPNSWRPDPKEPLPQWVELDFGRQVNVGCVHVSFQSEAMSAEEFRIETVDGDDRKTVATVAGNQQRRRVLRFERTAASKLRLVVTKATDQMGICEIRAYQ